MIVNQNRNTTIACKPFHAVRLWDRTRGMIGREFGEAFDAMVFSACNAIHTFFMKIPLDVLFLNRENTVVAQRSSLRPWHPCVWYSRACTVVELPVGTIEKTGTSIGDRLYFSADGMN
ncbi:MAG: DUF192 domain-containing protein [Lentisphaeria bacterium]|nr:DUF192 domain-containing protein [Lentisphaeria bacterium]